MSSTGLSDRVTRFIGEHIDSVEQLEVLLLLRRAAGQEWTADDVARELRIAAASAGGRLEDLERRGILARSDGKAGAFRYSPQKGEVDDSVGDLAAAYAERRVTVINLIFSRPNERIRTFADAFRVWRRD